MTRPRVCNWMRFVCATGIIVVVLPIWTRAQTQASQASDVQQLKDKLLQLEQEMNALKGQISAIEQPPQSADLTIPTAASSGTPAPEKPPKPQKEDEPKSNIDLYGFIMLDSGYDFKTNNPDWFDVIRPTKLPSFNGEFAPDGKAYFGVRQTRFGVKTSTPTGLGTLKTQFEFELFGTGVDAGQTTFRLRHAYGELGQFGAGQTWSPFMDIDVFPNSIEYWGPTGMVFFRNVQVRWMPIRSDNTRLTFAVERPGASADGGVYADRIEVQGVKPKFDMPDFSWEARFIRRWGYARFGGIFRKISWVDTNTTDNVDLTGDAFGWGVNFSSNLKFGKDTIGRFMVVYGAGIQNYMNDAPIDIGVKNNFSNPVSPIKGVALPLLGVVSFLDHNWSERFSSSIGYSMENIENSDAEKASDFHQGHYALTNLLYHPVPSVTIGSEFQFGRRVNFRDGFNVNDYRLQFSFKYDWRKLFEF
ncbi:MAG TPA: DcaP family trimeric outer membrane transporter [Terriglobales bacterium]|nr:DcaP family trimeric outer membrane transporter [Terriglobales bacterium]